MRITSGLFRGRKLVSPRADFIHPMGDREKIALFNSVSGVIAHGKVLDLYAGSGALGLEALSRGASEVVLVESQARAVTAIRANIAALEGPKEKKLPVTVFRSPVQQFLEKESDFLSYNLVIIDPPYDKFIPAEFQKAEDLLRLGGKIVLSHPKLDENCDPAGIFPKLRYLGTRKYARAHLSIYEKA